MKVKGVIAAGAVLLGAMPALSQAAELNYSVGVGFPFFFVPEISIATDSGEKRTDGGVAVSYQF